MLELFLTLLLGKEKSEKLSPLLIALKNNGYDLKSTLKNLDISALMPLVTSFTEGFFTAQEQPTTPPITTDFDDIKTIAGEEITDLLDGYFY